MLPALMVPVISVQTGVVAPASVETYNLPTSVPTYSCAFPVLLTLLQKALGAPFAVVELMVKV